MSRDPLIPQQTSLWSRFVAFKTILVSFAFVGLLASNVASLVSVSAHDWMHNALWQVLSIRGQSVADLAMENSPKAKLEDTVKIRTAHLEIRNKELAKELDATRAKSQNMDLQLKTTQIRSQKLEQQLVDNGKMATSIVQKVNARLLKGLKRGAAALPVEAVPYIGVMASVSVMTLDVYDACQTSQDFNTLLAMQGQPLQPISNCNFVIPTVDQVLVDVKTEWRKSYERVRDEAKQLKVPVPEIRPPSLDEVSKVTCPVVKLPGLCNKG